MKTLRFAMIGSGFWARFQLAGWLEAGGCQCVAVYNRTRAKAEALAREFNIPKVYDDPGVMLRETRPDFADIVTDVTTHHRFTLLAAGFGIPVVCQKPMAASLREAEEMVTFCRERGVPLLVNENWRWQAPIREFYRLLRRGDIGKIFRARIRMVSGFPVFQNQPFLREIEQFILTDVGSHVLDVARWMFGEPVSLYCHTYQAHEDIRGEDVATVMLKTEAGATVLVEMGYAENYLEHDRFPETTIFVEAARGSAELAFDYRLRVTTADGTWSRRCPPPHYKWADPQYDVVHASIVPCHANLLAALRREGEAETTGEDNLKTVRLVFAAYDSAARDQVCRLRD
ncbi:MAG TPA: Gfo/Idh/MocA family oxidoreductase [Acidobacteriota bacterium]|nr:Gfo/Idh/MocA family oxidoreductase [Acidobacteriota bacterium]